MGAEKSIENKNIMGSTSIFVISVFAIISGYQVTASCPADEDKPFSFDPNLPNGPTHWADLFEDCANYKIQSPINIVAKNAKPAMGSTGIKVTNYDKPFTKVQVTNNGYTVEFMPKDGIQRSVTFNGSTYPLKTFNIRFGEQMTIHDNTLTSPGSDHRLNNKQATAELQLIHGNPNKMVIVSALLQGTYNPDPVLDTIADAQTLRSINYEGDTFEKNLNKSYARLDTIVEPSSPFYAYKGSFSTPPCTPGVTWLIAKDRKPVNIALLIALTELHSVKQGDPNEDECHLQNNFRSPQPLAGRTVSSY